MNLETGTVRSQPHLFEALETLKETLAKIPAELQQLPAWVLWAADKVPYNPVTGARADVTKAETWATLAVAQKHFDPTVYSGLGCVIVKPYVGIDLDKCRNP